MSSSVQKKKSQKNEVLQSTSCYKFVNEHKLTIRENEIESLEKRHRQKLIGKRGNARLKSLQILTTGKRMKFTLFICIGTDSRSPHGD